jgi:hypothetical protein
MPVVIAEALIDDGARHGLAAATASGLASTSIAHRKVGRDGNGLATVETGLIFPSRQFVQTGCTHPGESFLFLDCYSDLETPS